MSSFDLGTDFPAKAAVNAPHHSRGFAPDGAVSYQADPPRGQGIPGHVSRAERLIARPGNQRPVSGQHP